MTITVNPPKASWTGLCARPSLQTPTIEARVDAILERVRTQGDAALFDYTTQFDGVELTQLQVSAQELQTATASVSDRLKAAIEVAAANIKKFHKAQRKEPLYVDTMPGVRCWQKSIPIEKVGLYIPGGTAPLFSTVLMLAIPAQLAGCKEIILCTPPRKDGSVDPAILFAATLAGCTSVYKVGGAQAIAAMAYGTAQIPQVYKILGPGNQYVTYAKQKVQQQGIAIDMPAGPSEVLVVMDETANPEFVAADLLAQAEHGTDSQVMVLSFDEAQLQAVQTALNKQLTRLPRQEIAQGALAHSRMIYFSDRAEGIEFMNLYAAEHLILNTIDAEALAEKVRNAGSVFLGAYTPESVGDYASGTNHTLPTNGFARAYSGVSLATFTKQVTFQQLTTQGLEKLGPAVIAMAEAESLQAHAEAVRIRLNKLNTKNF